MAGVGVAAAFVLALPGTALASANVRLPHSPTIHVIGEFVPYSRLSSMPASFRTSVLRSIARLPTQVRDAQVRELPLSLRSQVASIKPDSAEGCNQNVCLQVTGSGTYISNWNTWAFGNVGCTHALYLEDGALWLESLAICPTSSSDGVYYFYLNIDGSPFDADTTVCNNWVSKPINGFPCEEIE
jgi:hypothetical protein